VYGIAGGMRVCCYVVIAFVLSSIPKMLSMGERAKSLRHFGLIAELKCE
jgi:hypothetical protein